MRSAPLSPLARPLSVAFLLPRLVPRLVPLLASLACLPCMGCGGRILDREADGGPIPSASSPNADNDDGGTSSSSSTGTGTGTGDPFPLCPEVAPQPGWTCLNPSQGCAYVDVKQKTCASFTCDASGHWFVSTPDGCPS